MDLRFIEERAAEVFHTTAEAMHTRSKQRETVEARNVMYYYLYRQTNMSHNAIGRYFKRDHSTVTNGLKNVRIWTETDKFFRGKLKRFKFEVGMA